MLNIIDSNNLSIQPMNYYLTFAASDDECELEMALRVTHNQRNKLLDVLLLGYASQYHVDIPLELPVEITRTMDAGDGVNRMSENLSSKMVWLGMADEHVTLSVSGYPHAVRIPQQLLVDQLRDLYRKFCERSYRLSVRNKEVADVGVVSIFQAADRRAVRHGDLMLVASYGRASSYDTRLNSQPMTLYIQDVNGMWLYAEIASSPRYQDFVTKTQFLPL